MDPLLQGYDEASYRANLKAIDEFWRGKGRYLISTHCTQHSYRQCFDDALIQREAPLHLVAQAKLPGINLPAFFADWGTVSTAKYWGGHARFDSTGDNIFVDPVAHTVEEALALDPLPVDDPTMDAYRAVRLYRNIAQRLGTDKLWLRTPDMQGPLNTAGLVLDQEAMFIAMYTEPDKVHAFLEKVTEFLIRYARYLREATENMICGNIWPYTFFPASQGLALTEDLMPLMSAKLYKEFGIPTLRRLQEALGGLHIHCCGDWGRHARNLSASGLDIRAVEFHYPATRLEELVCLADQVVFIPYIILYKQDEFKSVPEYYRHLLEHSPSNYRFWFALAEDSPDMLAFAETYGNRG